MKKATITLWSAVLLGLAGCAHSTEEGAATGAQGTTAAATPQRSSEQLAIDDAEKAVKAANDEFAKSGNCNETKKLTDIAKQKIDLANATASTLQCRDHVAALQAQLDGLTQEQTMKAVADMAPPAKPAEQPAEQQPPAQALVKSPEGAVVVANFEVSDSNLPADTQGKLDDVVAKLQGNDSTVVIEGHTDNTGTEEFNEKLSLTRAASGRDYLVSKGIDASRIEIKGMGSRAPVVSNDTEADRAQNRRIEVVVASVKPVS